MTRSRVPKEPNLMRISPSSTSKGRFLTRMTVLDRGHGWSTGRSSEATLTPASSRVFLVCAITCVSASASRTGKLEAERSSSSPLETRYESATPAATVWLLKNSAFQVGASAAFLRRSCSRLNLNVPTPSPAPSAASFNSVGLLVLGEGDSDGGLGLAVDGDVHVLELAELLELGPQLFLGDREGQVSQEQPVDVDLLVFGVHLVPHLASLLALYLGSLSFIF